MLFERKCTKIDLKSRQNAFKVTPFTTNCLSLIDSE